MQELPPAPSRPPIGNVTSGAELKRWYWLRAELAAHAKTLGVSAAGGKFDILDRLAGFLDTGMAEPRAVKTVRSRFDWHSEPLTPGTVITDSYRNTQNVRRFFCAHAGPGFNFTIAFMEWMKASPGRTLGDAVAHYHAMKAQAAQPRFATAIKPHNQFNKYAREFLADNPHLSMEDVRRVWALKRALPSETGRHVYARSDLELGKSSSQADLEPRRLIVGVGSYDDPSDLKRQ